MMSFGRSVPLSLCPPLIVHFSVVKSGAATAALLSTLREGTRKGGGGAAWRVRDEEAP